MQMYPRLTAGSVASLHIELYYLKRICLQNRGSSYCITKTMIYEKKDLCLILLAAMLVNIFPFNVFASSHREAPLIANDPLADNTDLYAFRSPDDPSKVTIIANYIPGQLPQGGPNYYPVWRKYPL